jgi:hypothetical protein
VSPRSCAVPDGALLSRYRNGHDFADCYMTTVDGRIAHDAFVAAFYTTWLFKLERWILQWLVRKPSTDGEAVQLACGAANGFAAWTVEARAADQLLMCDFPGNTRSWLMVVPEEARTRLYFGSAVVARVDKKTGKRTLGTSFRMLLGFHRLYSRALLSVARRRLEAVHHRP